MGRWADGSLGILLTGEIARLGDGSLGRWLAGEMARSGDKIIGSLGEMGRWEMARQGDGSVRRYWLAGGDGSVRSLCVCNVCVVCVRACLPECECVCVCVCVCVVHAYIIYTCASISVRMCFQGYQYNP